MNLLRPLIEIYVSVCVYSVRKIFCLHVSVSSQNTVAISTVIASSGKSFEHNVNILFF